MKTDNEYFDQDGWLKDKYLWTLRQQIVLGSLHISDYKNKFGLDPKEVCDFFDGFWCHYVYELAEEDGLKQQIEDRTRAEFPNASEEEIQRWVSADYEDEVSKRYDNEDALLSWYGCFCDNPFPLKKYETEFFARFIPADALYDDDVEEDYLEITFEIFAHSSDEADMIAWDALKTEKLNSDRCKLIDYGGPEPYTANIRVWYTSCTSTLKDE